MPRAIILAGPNGAGKTTFAKEFLPNEAECVQFVNADLIAAGLSPFAPDTAEIAAGRSMIRRIEELVAESSDFAVEITLSGVWLLKHIHKWKSLGYEIYLYYLSLDSADLALERIAARVAKGGHNIPPEVVRRRFRKGLVLLDQAYKPIVDKWMVYDNSGSEPRLISNG
jgi:predicted ABC-type ATPase